MSNGKGSKPRPISNRQKFYENYDAIFRKKKKKVLEKEEKVCDNA